MDAGILAVKRLDRAKSRLGPHFAKGDRAAIAEALWRDALALVTAADSVRWLVVTDDDRVAADARTAGLGVLRDPGAGLNLALEYALEAIDEAQPVTVMPSDIPLATTQDLNDLLDTGATSDVVVVPSNGDGGTNALYLGRADLLAPRFGPGSLEAHVAAADERGLRCSILVRERIALDIDTIEDVDELLGAADTRTHTSVVLERIRRAASR
jgi:2-phospho-L-lactate guanylyltransferase